MMIEFLSLFYGIAKDIKDCLSWDEETKLVDRIWVEKSGFTELMEKEGYKLRWSSPEKVEAKKLDGYEIMYEIDKIKRVKRRVERRDSSILMGKK